MVNYQCKCGHVMNLSTNQESYELRLVSNAQIEKIGEKIFLG